ncbi:MAG: hypothetical protein KJ585_04870 [Alphaproteobacteria bacterium]|nr:hypothetical protein [Alphaproteobacteria bacterium]
MAISELINGLADALAEVRAELTTVESELSRLENDRASIINAPPHTSDIIASFMRGLDKAAASFEERLAWNLNDRNATADQVADAAKGAAQLLMVNAERPPEMPAFGAPGRIRAGLFPPSALVGPNSVLDVAAVTYFLRDRIEAAIPGLVERFCPAASKGVPQAVREAALKEVDDKIIALKEKRDELVSNLAAARKAANLS